MVMYIRLVTRQQQADEDAAERFRELWADNGHHTAPPPVRSLPIKVWALLNEEPMTAQAIAETLACPLKSVYVAVQRLRDAGQNIINRRNGRGPGSYCLLQGPPMKIVESREGIRLPNAGARRCRDEVVIELK